jgi:hypothetical protein
MPSNRFVILEHFHEGVHYDLMFESGGVLKTWKLAEPPRAGSAQPALLSFDHRLMYLDHEGPISGDRGHVIRWDQGTYDGSLADASLIRIRLSGRRLKGEIELQHQEGDRWEVRLIEPTNKPAS